MPRAKPPKQFLLRASVAMVGLAILWWFLLLTPILAVFRGAAEFFGRFALGTAPCDLITETTSGDWHFCVPVDIVVPNDARQGMSRLNSIEFDMARSDLYIFTFGLPVFWALTIGAAEKRGWLRRLVLGTMLTALLEVVLLLLFLRTFAHGVNPTHDPVISWWLHFGQYLEVNVIPDVLPFAVALFVHRRLWTDVPGVFGTEDVTPSEPRDHAKRRHRKSKVMTAQAGKPV